jgi:hypothetical protein
MTHANGTAILVGLMGDGVAASGCCGRHADGLQIGGSAFFPSPLSCALGVSADAGAEGCSAGFASPAAFALTVPGGLR